MFYRILIFDRNLAFCKGYSPFIVSIFANFQKTCHFSNITSSLKLFFAQKNSNRFIIVVFHMFYRILIFDPNWAFCIGYSPRFVSIFAHFQTIVIFQILRAFWSWFFAQKSSNVFLDSFFTCFVEFSDFQKLVIFRIIAVFWSCFLRRKTLMCF